MKGKKSIKPSIPGMTFVRKLGGISEYKLDGNGLQVLLAPDTSIPVVGVMVTYHVGSRHEATGYTGSAHLLEHLLFKGSKNFNKKKGGVFSEVLENQGARNNASTWYDRTNYYEILPKALLSKTLAYEADRMRDAYILEADRVTEMPVVRSEFEIFENRPLEVINNYIWTAAFRAHPYHHPVIGWRSDIENVSIERLQQFYADFYRPGNATLTVVGDFETQDVLAEIVRTFGKNKNPQEPMPKVYTTEPKQDGERRGVVKRGGDLNMVGIAYKTPEALHADMPALFMLSLILADGKTSRLYRAFIDTAKATDVLASAAQMRDPALFETYITLAPKTTHAAAEKLTKEIFEEIKKKGVTARELAQAKQSIRAYLATRRDGAYALLANLNEDIATGDWTRFVTFPDVLQEVTAKQVQAVAAKYLVDDQSTVVYYIGTTV